MGVSGSAIPLPLLLQIPKVLFDGGAGLLGLGDIVLPGVLLAKLFRVDVSRARSGLRAKHVQRDLSLFEVLAMERGSYFVPALCAYVVGLVITLAALAVLQMGQPGRGCVCGSDDCTPLSQRSFAALLYLVPSVSVGCQ